MIIVKRRDGYYVISKETGKNLVGPHKTKEEAETALRRLEYFKRAGIFVEGLF